jgi:hypothetical protein
LAEASTAIDNLDAQVESIDIDIATTKSPINTDLCRLYGLNREEIDLVEGGQVCFWFAADNCRLHSIAAEFSQHRLLSIAIGSVRQISAATDIPCIGREPRRGITNSAAGGSRLKHFARAGRQD